MLSESINQIAIFDKCIQPVPLYFDLLGQTSLEVRGLFAFLNRQTQWDVNILTKDSNSKCILMQMMMYSCFVLPFPAKVDGVFNQLDNVFVTKSFQALRAI